MGSPISDRSQFIEQYISEVVGLPVDELPSWVSTFLGKLDKKEVEDVLAVLAPSMMNPAAALTYWQNIGTFLGIGGIGSRIDGIGSQASQGSMVLAALDSWARSDPTQNNLLQENALQDYVESGGGGDSSDTMQALQFLRGSPILSAVISIFDPSLVGKASEVAEQQVATAYLEQWANSQVAFAEQAGEAQSPSLLMLQDYISNVKDGKQTLSSPIVSMLVAGVLGGSEVQLPLTVDQATGVISIDPSKDSLMPLGLDPSGFTGAPPQAQIDLNQISANTIFSCSYWAIPSAITLFQSDPIESPNAAQKASAFAYAQSLSAYVESPQFDAFVKNTLLKNTSLTDDQITAYTAELKVNLLAGALAAVDKAQMDSSIIRGQDMLDLINGTAVGNTNPWGQALVKLINEQLNIIKSISPDQYNALLKNIFTYYDTNPNMRSLTDPARAFVTLTDPRFFRQSVITQNSA